VERERDVQSGRMRAASIALAAALRVLPAAGQSERELLEAEARG
jgi:hypothetical protein